MAKASTRRTVPVLAALALSCVLATTATAGMDIVNDLPANELSLDSLLPTVPSEDSTGAVFGDTSGSVCALMIEDLTLRSANSANGGATWGAETDVADDVKDYAAALAADGSVYVAMIVGDASGDLGLTVRRSDDMCGTWSANATVAQSGDAYHGVRSVSIATGSSGFVAVVFRGGGGINPYATVSTSSGTSWTTPVRLDAGVAVGAFASVQEDVAVDPANDNVYVAFAQDRSGNGPIAFPENSVWFTRSTNSGVSFAAEQSLDGVLTTQFDSQNPDIEVADDGSVVIALWDASDTTDDRIFVVRSTDQGLSYGETLNDVRTDTDTPLVPRLFPSPSTGTVLLTVISDINELEVRRSANRGTSWGSIQTLATTVAGLINGDRDLSIIAATRTGSGTWAIAWSDDRADAYTRLRTDVYVRTSTTDGASWGAEQRADSSPAGARSWLSGLAANGADNLFVLYEDDRGTTGRSSDFYGNDSPAAALSFGADARVDSDAGQVSPQVLFEPSIAADGVGHVYVAFSAYTTGPETDLHVSVSSDGGYTFGTPVRVGSTTAGTRVEALPVIRATSDGNVYLAFISDDSATDREIRFNHSTDFGATWQGDQVLGTVTQGAGYSTSLDWPAIDVAALPGGVVYVTWSTSANVFLARSTNAGTSFTIADVDQDNRGFNRFPRICAQGNQVIIVWMGADLAFQDRSVWGIVSGDQGATWTTSTQLRPESALRGVDLHTLACNGASGAIAVWPDRRGPAGIFELFSSRWDGNIWTPNVVVNEPPGVEHLNPAGTYVNGTSNFSVVYEDFEGGVYVTRSINGGASFLPFVRLDSTAPVPAAASMLPRIVTDGGTNVWIAWLDESPGLASFVMRHSSDSGTTYGAIQRIDRKTPQGGLEELYFDIGAATPATAAGTAFFTWSGERDSLLLDVLVNVHDLDDADRDQSATGVDCDDADPTVIAQPTVVSGVGLDKVTGAARLSWDSQILTAGSSTAADIVTGTIADLKAMGDYSAAICLIAGQPGTTYDDTRADPAPGVAWYYVMRLRNGCGPGTYGDSTIAPDPRDDLDATSPCP
ncbi:MAG: sialidase family protein [Acidobacteriota bacterium]|nr:sialidase family protein [Acidobacteriota bacterium]